MLTCREAKIHDALLFFDECEAIFEDREKHGSNHVNMLLTEVEKHEGIIIMATNRYAALTVSKQPHIRRIHDSTSLKRESVLSDPQASNG